MENNTETRIKWYYPPDSEELSFLGRMVNCPIPVDRTDRLNKLRWDFTPIPKDFSDAKTWEECCYSRAQELWSLGKPITLFWSGGIDSSVAFLSLRETMSIKDELHVRYTQESIDEFPILYNDVKEFSSPFLSSSIDFFAPDFLNQDHIFVTGECGDQVFGTDAVKRYENEMNEPWKNVLYFKNLWLPDSINQPDSTDRFKILSLLEQYILKCPIEIKTVFDIYWWLSFSIKWEYVSKVIFLIFFKNDGKDLHKNYCFFNTQDFQKWSLANHDMKHKNTWLSYKQPAKDFIYKFTGDKEYQKNKLKEPSLMKLCDEEFVRSRWGNGDWTEDQLFLLLDDGRFWRRGDTIPKEVLAKL